MGVSQSQSSQQQIMKAERMAQIGQIPADEFHQLRSVFMQASGDSRLSYNEFVRFFANIVGMKRHSIDAHVMAQRVFHAIDLDNNGYISFDEFIIAYILLYSPGDPNERITKFLMCYFGGYIPEKISQHEAAKITKSLNVLSGVQSQPSFGSHLGYGSQPSPFNQPYGGSFAHTGSSYHASSGINRDQFIYGIATNPSYQSSLY